MLVEEREQKRRRTEFSADELAILQTAWSSGLTSLKTDDQRQQVDRLAVQLGKPALVIKVTIQCTKQAYVLGELVFYMILLYILQRKGVSVTVFDVIEDHKSL